MIVNDIKTIVTQTLGYEFQFGTKPVLNLKNTTADEEGIIFLLLPPNQRAETNGLNRVVARVWDLAMFVGVKSEFDSGTEAENGEDFYMDRWTRYIKPLYDDEIVEGFVQEFACLEDITIQDYQTIELIQFLDWNMDGLWVTMRVRQEYS